MSTGRGVVRIAGALLLWGAGGTWAWADGDRDPTFGSGGERLFPREFSTHTTNTSLGDIAIQSDRRIVWTIEGGDGSVLLGRLLPNGAVDAEFGDQGRIRIAHCVPSPTRRLQIALDSDDAIVIWTGRCLLRFVDGGTPDPGFASGAAFPEPPFEAAELLRDSAGRWVLAGSGGSQASVWRFLSSGANDVSFGSGGVASPLLPAGQFRQIQAMRLRSGNMPLLGGSLSISNRTNLLLVQLGADGALDANFGVDGLRLVPPPDGFAAITVEALALDGAGGVLIAGDGNNGMQSCCALLTRLHGDGQPDAAFGLRLMHPPGNTVLSDFGESTSALLVFSDGQLLLARNSFPFPGPENTRTRFTLIRTHADGNLDAAFGTQGWRSYVVQDPTGAGLGGPYTQFHGMAFDHGTALMYGRTFFEDSNAAGGDYVSLMRVTIGPWFADGFEP